MTSGALRFAAVPVGSGALTSCASCAARSEGVHDAAEVVEGRIAEAVAAWGEAPGSGPHSGPGPNVFLTGPEPFDHPELPRLVAACASAGAERIGMLTDGGALAAGGNAPGVLHAGVTHLAVRVFAADVALGDRLSGTPGSVAAARAGVRALLAAAEAAAVPVVVTAVVPVCPHTLASLASTVAALAEWGVHAVRLELASALGSAEAATPTASASPAPASLPSSAATTLAAACDTGMVNRVWVEVDPALPLPETHRLHAIERGWFDV